MSFISRRYSNHSVGRFALSNDELSQLAPSAFAVAKHESRSERYAYIPTVDVIEGLRSNGFLPMFAKQSKSRVEGKAEFTKHLIRFRYQGQGPTMRQVGETFPAVVLVNSHDGTSAYKLMAGLMRLVCLNGMVVSDREFATVTVPHKGDVIGQVIEGSCTVLGESRKAIEAADAWAGVTLNRDEQHALAEAAHVIRFGDAEGTTDTVIKPEQMLAPRRNADAGNDLWRTFNRVQENAIRGGMSAWGRDANGRPRRTTTRDVNGIDADVKINKALWMLGERMAQIKNA